MKKLFTILLCLVAFKAISQNTITFEAERIIGGKYKIHHSVLNHDQTEETYNFSTTTTDRGMNCIFSQGEGTLHLDMVNGSLWISRNTLPAKDHFVFKTPFDFHSLGGQYFHNVDVESRTIVTRGVFKAFKANITTDYIFNAGAFHFGYKGAQSDVDLPYLYWKTPGEPLDDKQVYVPGVIQIPGGTKNPLHGWIVADEGLDIIGMTLTDESKIRGAARGPNKSLIRGHYVPMGSIWRE